MEKETSDNITALWQRLIDAENRITELEKPSTLPQRVATLEEVRKVQISLNERFLKAMNANPDKPSTTKEWWKKLLG